MEGVEGEGKEAPEAKTIPTTALARIMRLALPPNAKITGDAKEAVDRCVGEFAAVVIRAAVQECRQDSRVTVTGNDLIAAMRSLGFDDYVGPLAEYLRRYRESEGIVPRGRQTALPLPAPPVAVAPPVEVETQPSSPLDLALGLGRPSPCDVTELGLHTNVYTVWPGPGGASAAGTSRAPPAGDDK